MIEKDDGGGAISAGFTTRIGAKYDDGSNKPIVTALFCRELSGTSYTRDVTQLFADMTMMKEAIGADDGFSRGNTTSFMFDNAPLAELTVAYVAGTTLTVQPRLQKFALLTSPQDDWISITDGLNVEYKRVTGLTTAANGGLTAITIHSALSNNYAVGTEIRYAWAIEPTETTLNSTQQDQFIGSVRIKLGFENESDTVIMYQGEIVNGTVSNDQQVLINCRSIIQKLVKLSLTGDYEVGDRGLASRPSPDAGNTGDGVVSPITYAIDSALRGQILTEAWTATYDATAVDDDGNTVGGWDITTGAPRTIASGNIPPNHDGEGAFVPTGESGGWRWDIDLRANEGLGFVIEEGDTAWVNGDTMKFWSLIDGTLGVILGEDAISNPIDTGTLSSLSQASVIEHFFDQMLEIDYWDPELGTHTNMFETTQLAHTKTLAQDYDIQGQFLKGTPVMDVIMQALLVANGYIAQKHSGELYIRYHSTEELNDATDKTLSSNVADGTNTYNVLNITAVDADNERVVNKIVVRHDKDYRNIEVVNTDASSITDFGERQFKGRTSEEREIDKETAYLYVLADVNSASTFFFNRFAAPMKQFRLEGTPDMLMLEPGDIIEVYSSSAQYAGRAWVMEVEKHLLTLQTRLLIEENPQAAL